MDMRKSLLEDDDGDSGPSRASVGHDLTFKRQVSHFFGVEPDVPWQARLLDQAKEGFRSLRPRNPIADWLPANNIAWKDTIFYDFLAGLSVGIYAVPGSMAYALIAGLPPIEGLYAAAIPVLVYPFFGTSRQLSIGPSSLMSLLNFSIVNNSKVQAEKVALSQLLALQVGMIMTFMAFFGLSFVTHFVSNPVIEGFTFAAAFIIVSKELPEVLGIHVDPKDTKGMFSFFKTLYYTGEGLAEGHAVLSSVLFGLATFVLMFLLYKYKHSSLPGAKTAKHVPSILVVVGLGIGVASAVGGLCSPGHPHDCLAILGEVPDGMPTPEIPWKEHNGISFDDFVGLLPKAAIMALIGLIESMAVSSKFAAQHGYQINTRRELLGIGLANIVGAFFRSYAVTGALSRTTLANNTGARSVGYQFFQFTIVALTLQVLAPVFKNLPMSVLASVVISSVIGLANPKVIVRLYNVKKRDVVVLVACAACVFIFGVDVGIELAILISILVFIHQSAFPYIATLGRLPGSGAFTDAKYHPEAEPVPGVTVLRPDASLFFANMQFLATRVYDVLRLARKHERPLHTIVLDFSSVSDIDSSSAQDLKILMVSLLRGETTSVTVENDDEERADAPVNPAGFSDGEGDGESAAAAGGDHDSGTVDLLDLETPAAGRPVRQRAQSRRMRPLLLQPSSASLSLDADPDSTALDSASNHGRVLTRMNTVHFKALADYAVKTGVESVLVCITRLKIRPMKVLANVDLLDTVRDALEEASPDMSARDLEQYCYFPDANAACSYGLKRFKPTTSAGAGGAASSFKPTLARVDSINE